jgi:hypothetical protein
MGNKLVRFAPNLNHVLDFHWLHHITAGLSRPQDRPGSAVFLASIGSPDLSYRCAALQCDRPEKPQTAGERGLRCALLKKGAQPYSLHVFKCEIHGLGLSGMARLIVKNKMLSHPFLLESCYGRGVANDHQNNPC